MVDISVNLKINEATAIKVLQGQEKLHFELESPGMTLYRLVEEAQPNEIVETGTLRDSSLSSIFSDGWSTFYFAAWKQVHKECKVTSIELDSNAIETAREVLKKFELEPYIDFWNADSLWALRKFDKENPEFFFLDSCDGLEHGLEEFRLAANYNPKMIVMDDWDTKTKLTAETVRKEGTYTITRIGRYTVFRNKTWLNRITSKDSLPESHGLTAGKKD